MKAIHLILVAFSVLFCVGSFIGMRAAIKEKIGLPDYYRRLDTSLPFNDLARKSLDSRISNAEYDAIRWQYFEDRVINLVSPLQTGAAWEEFKQKTERPNFPGRRKTLGDYLELFEFTLAASALYLTLAIALWLWKKPLKPAREILTEDGVYGLIRVVLFGKKGVQPK